MNAKINLSSFSLRMTIITILIAIVCTIQPASGTSREGVNPYPPPPGPSPSPEPGGDQPPASPTPPVEPIPGCHTLAMAFVNQQHGIPLDRLITGSFISSANGVWVSDNKVSWVDLPLTGQRVCVAKVFVKDEAVEYSVAISEDGEVVDLEELRGLEREAQKTQCGDGKFTPLLCSRIPEIADGDELEVAIWITGLDEGAIYDQVAENYPPSLQPERAQPFDNNHPDYEKALQDLDILLEQAYREYEAPLLNYLEAKGYPARGASTVPPIIFVRLPKHVIIELVSRDDVGTIYLLEGEIHDLLNSAIPTTRNQYPWNAGYDGSGIKVAVVEDDSLDFGDQYIDHASSGVTCEADPAQPNEGYHANQLLT